MCVIVDVWLCWCVMMCLGCVMIVCVCECVMWVNDVVVCVFERCVWLCNCWDIWCCVCVWNVVCVMCVSVWVCGVLVWEVGVCVLDVGEVFDWCWWLLRCEGRWRGARATRFGRANERGRVCGWLLCVLWVKVWRWSWWKNCDCLCWIVCGFFWLCIFWSGILSRARRRTRSRSRRFCKLMLLLECFLCLVGMLWCIWWWSWVSMKCRWGDYVWF